MASGAWHSLAREHTSPRSARSSACHPGTDRSTLMISQAWVSEMDLQVHLPWCCCCSPCAAAFVCSSACTAAAGSWVWLYGYGSVCTGATTPVAPVLQVVCTGATGGCCGGATCSTDATGGCSMDATGGCSTGARCSTGATGCTGATGSCCTGATGSWAGASARAGGCRIR